MPDQRARPLWSPLKTMDPRKWKPDQQKLDQALMGKDAERKDDGRRPHN
jgi:hypothetical protein